MSSERPRVLVLDEEVPLPPNTGKRIRTYNLLTRLASEFAIDLMVHADGADPEVLAELMSRDIRVLVSPSRIPAKDDAAFPMRVMANLLGSRLPYSVASHTRPEYIAYLARTFAENRYDMVHCEWTPYANYLRGCLLPVVVAAHNVEAQVWARLAEAERHSPKGWVYAVQARRMDAFERWVFASASHATAVSEGDAYLIGGMGASDVTVVPNGVDTAYFAPVPETADARGSGGSVVFTGSMDWRPNQDGVRWYLDEVHPLLAARDTVRVSIVGRNPPASLSRNLPHGVEVTGTVDDVRPYIAGADVYMAPLRAGGGSRLKILEALAMAKPVVSTTVGAEGLELDAGVHYVAADDPESFAAAVADLLRDPDRGRALAKAGRERVLERYGWDGIAAIQAKVWHRAIQSGE